MQPPSERLRLARKRRGYSSAAKAATAFGWNIHSYSSHESGNRGIPHDAAIKYARALRFSLDWLYFGDETISPQVSLDDPAKTAVVIPMMDWDYLIQMGDFEQAMAEVKAGAAFPIFMDIVMPAFIIDVPDDSMTNATHLHSSFNSSDRLIFSTRAPLKPGDFVLAELMDEQAFVFRQYRARGKSPDGFITFDLAPLNTAYPTVTVRKREDARIVAKLTHTVRAH